MATHRSATSCGFLIYCASLRVTLEGLKHKELMVVYSGFRGKVFAMFTLDRSQMDCVRVCFDYFRSRHDRLAYIARVVERFGVDRRSHKKQSRLNIPYHARSVFLKSSSPHVKLWSFSFLTKLARLPSVEPKKYRRRYICYLPAGRSVS